MVNKTWSLLQNLDVLYYSRWRIIITKNCHTKFNIIKGHGNGATRLLIYIVFNQINLHFKVKVWLAKYLLNGGGKILEEVMEEEKQDMWKYVKKIVHY